MFIPPYRKWFQEQQLPCDEYADKIQFLFAIMIDLGLNLEKHFLILFLNYVMKLKIKKTWEKILKDSQKLKYASLVGGNAFVMAMFYSLILL